MKRFKNPADTFDNFLELMDEQSGFYGDEVAMPSRRMAYRAGVLATTGLLLTTGATLLATGVVKVPSFADMPPLETPAAPASSAGR